MGVMNKKTAQFTVDCMQLAGMVDWHYHSPRLSEVEEDEYCNFLYFLNKGLKIPEVLEELKYLRELRSSIGPAATKDLVEDTNMHLVNLGSGSAATIKECDKLYKHMKRNPGLIVMNVKKKEILTIKHLN